MKPLLLGKDKDRNISYAIQQADHITVIILTSNQTKNVSIPQYSSVAMFSAYAPFWTHLTSQFTLPITNDITGPNVPQLSPAILDVRRYTSIYVGSEEDNKVCIMWYGDFGTTYEVFK